jgi:hypothetical protein
MATFYLDLENGNDANTGADWANAWKTITSGATAARIAPGDEIRIAKTPDPVSIGNATWTKQSQTVNIASGVVLTLDTFDTSTYTAANSATVSRISTVPIKQGTFYLQVVTPASTATNTKYAYRNLGTAVDLSSYDAITLWFRNNTSAIADNNRYVIKLCSDTTGDTAVDTFQIPAMPSTARWFPVTVKRNGGGNLGSSIQSIAIYTGSSSPGNTQTIRLDNLMACTASSLNLNSLVSKNSSASWTSNDAWWGIQALSSNSITLGFNPDDTIARAVDTYYTTGTSPETVTTYVINPVTAPTIGTVNSTAIETIQDSGTAGNLITFSGGWNTSTSSKDGFTWIDGLNGFGYYLTNDQSYIKITDIGLARFQRVFESSTTTSAAYNELNNIYMTNIVSQGYSSEEKNSTITNIFGTANASTVITTSNNSSFDNIYAYSFNGGVGFSFAGDYSYVSDAYTANGVNYSGGGSNGGIILDSENSTYDNINIDLIEPSGTQTYSINASGRNNIINDLTITNSTSVRGLQLNTTSGLPNKLRNVTITNNSNAVTLVGSQGGEIYNLTESGNTTVFVNTIINGVNNYFSVNGYNGNANDIRYFYQALTNATADYIIFGQQTERHTASGLAWQVNVLNTGVNINLPALIPLAKIAVNASSLVTFKCWVKKSHATDIAANIFVRAFALDGINSKVTATKSNDTNWEELTITFTPTEKGIVEIFGNVWWVANAATQSVYFDDITITQA